MNIHTLLIGMLLGSIAMGIVLMVVCYFNKKMERKRQKEYRQLEEEAWKQHMRHKCKKPVIKASCTWGFAEDVCIEGKNVVAVLMSELWKRMTSYGVATDWQIGLSAEQAIQLGEELIWSGKNAQGLEKACKESNKSHITEDGDEIEVSGKMVEIPIETPKLPEE